MADNRSTFIQRVISAALAIVIIFSLGFFGGKTGLYIACTIAIVLSIREFSRMAFRPGVIPFSVPVLFWTVSILFYGAMVNYYELGLLWIALASAFFLSGALWLCRSRVNNENLLPSLTLGTFGMIYCVLFPNYAVQIVKLDDGDQWFLFLLLVVFFGDTGAYFAGRFLGRIKLMPQVSPNKTWEGAVGGMLASALAGTVHVMIKLPYVNWYDCVLFCVVCGFVAQAGDLLMSLVKRVAHVKDTGGIMPGHGGVLDRLDGLFIACPLVYAFALYVTPQ